MGRTDTYHIIAEIFPRFLGLIYFIVFAPFLFQIKGLIGSSGILPVKEYFDSVKSRFKSKAYYYLPSIFWLDASDKALMAAVWTGTLLSLYLFFIGHPVIILPILYLLYFSIVSAGQDFLSFGWELFLLEITVNTIFLTWTDGSNPFIWISLNLLLFRFHLQAGAVKLQSRDPNWRNLTAIAHHYLSQPIPNTIAWYAHKLPMSFQKLSCLMMFFIELIVPFGMIFNEDIRFLVFLAFAGLQFFIWLTGNFSYLNYMTVAFSTILISDQYLEPVFGKIDQVSHAFTPLDICISMIGSLLILLQTIRIYHHFFPNRLFSRLLSRISPLFIANQYGIFAVMTTKRHEMIIEGSNDGTEWKEYTFKYKPSEISRRPRRISPYQPRLDWQVWFLPFIGWGQAYWFHNFIFRLLKNEPEVLKLIRGNPFPGSPPKFIRVMTYNYIYTTTEEKRKSGNWWKRSFVGHYSPVMELRDH